ncbi:YeeE/YedE family protein [candidate division KSB1 bacterium]|nr:YeeE/YedE family protein [candidate division KSB1 bacterium]RQW02086.1 MAG: YeeE/YedE family protein [candidate division KSB1 bacterium]
MHTTYWPWYIAGPLIGLFVPLLYIIGNKAFGLSSSFDHMCYIITPKNRKAALKFDAGQNAWKTFFVLGIAIGALITQFVLSDTPKPFLPEKYYSLPGFIFLFIGGLFIGFGTRYANGCTSGHAITGLSLLNPASLYSTLAFFISGALFTWLLYFLF